MLQSPGLVFDMQEGVFTDELPQHNLYLEQKAAALLAELSCVMQPAELAGISGNADQRRKILEALENYYALHIQDFGKMKTLPVLKELLSWGANGAIIFDRKEEMFVIRRRTWIIFDAVLNDDILIQELREGKDSAFKTIVDEYQNMVYNTCLSIVKSEEDAEDIAQEVFVQVYQSIGSFKGESKLSTWIYRIATTKSLDHERKKKRKKRFGLVKSIFGDNSEVVVDPPDFHHPGVALDKKENAARLFRAIDKLPDNQKTAFILNKVEGLSYQEVSEVMEVSVSSVESLLHRAKNNLKKILEDNL